MALKLVRGQNHLNVDEHIERILRAKSKMKEGLIEFVIAMRNAYEQLPDKTFQNEIAQKINIWDSLNMHIFPFLLFYLSLYEAEDFLRMHKKHF